MPGLVGGFGMYKILFILKKLSGYYRKYYSVVVASSYFYDALYYLYVIIISSCYYYGVVLTVVAAKVIFNQILLFFQKEIINYYFLNLANSYLSAAYRKVEVLTEGSNSFFVFTKIRADINNLDNNKEQYVETDKNIIPVTPYYRKVGVEVRKEVVTVGVVDIKKLKSQIGSYLAGLIEGDGTIAVHNPKSNSTKFSPKIIIVFKKADLPLAKFLQNLTKCGQILIKPERGYVLWQIQDIVSVYTIISIINGFMRTPKIEALKRTIDWINNYILINNKNEKLLLLPTKYGRSSTYGSTKLILNNISMLEFKPLDDSPIDSNAWLSGFTDADGNFSINIHKRTNKNSTRVQLYYRLEVNQNYHKLDTEGNKVSFFPIMSKIGLFLGVTVYSRSRVIKDKIYYSFIIVSHNKLSNSKICDYFNKYPLLSSKFLDYKDWNHILNLQNFNKTTTSYLDKAIKIKTDFNKTRTTFIWDHLHNNN